MLARQQRMAVRGSLLELDRGRLGGLPSDHLAKYPVWPGEIVTRADSPHLVATAQATARAYSVPRTLAYGATASDSLQRC